MGKRNAGTADSSDSGPVSSPSPSSHEGYTRKNAIGTANEKDKARGEAHRGLPEVSIHIKEREIVGEGVFLDSSEAMFCFPIKHASCAD